MPSTTVLHSPEKTHQASLLLSQGQMILLQSCILKVLLSILPVLHLTARKLNSTEECVPVKIKILLVWHKPATPVCWYRMWWKKVSEINCGDNEFGSAKWQSPGQYQYSYCTLKLLIFKARKSLERRKIKIKEKATMKLKLA